MLRSLHALVLALVTTASASALASDAKDFRYDWVENTDNAWECAKVTPGGGFIHWADESLCSKPGFGWEEATDNTYGCALVVSGTDNFIRWTAETSCPAAVYDWVEDTENKWQCAQVTPDGRKGFIRWTAESHCD